MSFEPNERQALLLWTMIAGATHEERQPMWSAARPDLAARERTALLDQGFVEKIPGKSKKGGRASFMALTDKAWEWASHAHDVEIMRSQFASNALQGLLRRLVPFLERREIALAELFRDDEPALDEATASSTRERAEPQQHPTPGMPAAPVAPPPPAPSADSLRTRIEQSCLSLAGGAKKSRVRLSALRRSLPAVSRQQLDAALIDLQNALIALRHVNFDWTAHIDEIWVDQQHETERLQDSIRRELQGSLETLKDNRKVGSPLGIPLLGSAGSGKTHLLGFLRRQALAQGTYFILADMTDVADFSETVTLSYLRSLQQHSDGRRQVDRWLDRMIDLYGQGNRKTKDIPKQRPPALINRADELIAQVRAKHRAETQEHADVLRALILFACDHADVNDLGYKWLQGLVIDDEELGVFGFQQKHQTPSRIVRGLSWLLSLTGPSVLALDQLDAIVAEHELSRSELDAETPSDEQRRSLAIIQSIAAGLLGLRDLTRRTLCVVSSLEATWNILHGQATVSMADRYDSTLLLRPGTGPDVFRELVIGRLRPSYQEHGFEPPYPAYPYSEAFFEKYRDNTPRELLKACEAHRKACRSTNGVTETGGDSTPIVEPPPGSDDRWKATVESRIQALSAQADVTALLTDDSENLQDRVVEAACDALLLENPVPDYVSAKVEKDFMGTGSYDPLHARIRLVLTHQRERELHQSFRFLEKYHPRAFQARLKAALTASGIDQDLRFRGLTILRTSPIPSGAATEKLVAELQTRGGRIVTPSERELSLLLTLEELLRKNELDRLGEWLALERPVSKMACFASAVSSLLAALEARTSEPPPAAEPSDEPEASPNPEPVAVPGGVAPHVTPIVPVRQPPPATSEKPVVRVQAPNAILPIGRKLVANEPQEEVGIALERLHTIRASSLARAAARPCSSSGSSRKPRCSEFRASCSTARTICRGSGPSGPSAHPVSLTRMRRRRIAIESKPRWSCGRQGRPGVIPCGSVHCRTSRRPRPIQRSARRSCAPPSRSRRRASQTWSSRAARAQPRSRPPF